MQNNISKVFGGNGFIGKALLNSLSSDRLCDAKIDNFSQLCRCIGSKNDIVVNCAAKLMRKPCSIEQLYMSNFIGVVNLLEIAKNGDINRLVQLSTGDCLNKHQSDYAMSKSLAEDIVLYYINKYNVNANIIRLFGVYGPEQPSDYANIIVKIVNAIKNKQKYVIWKNYYRYFTYINDVVNFILYCDYSQYTIADYGYQEAYNMEHVNDIICGLMGVPIDKYATFHDAHGDLPIINNEHMNKQKIYPLVSIENGINNIIDYLEEQ